MCVWSSQDIIKKLVDNHATFGDKTEYSQVKYIKKKKKKWVTYDDTDTACSGLSFNELCFN